MFSDVQTAVKCNLIHQPYYYDSFCTMCRKCDVGCKIWLQQNPRVLTIPVITGCSICSTVTSSKPHYRHVLQVLAQKLYMVVHKEKTYHFVLLSVACIRNTKQAVVCNNMHVVSVTLVKVVLDIATICCYNQWQSLTELANLFPTDYSNSWRCAASLLVLTSNKLVQCPHTEESAGFKLWPFSNHQFYALQKLCM